MQWLHSAYSEALIINVLRVSLARAGGPHPLGLLKIAYAHSGKIPLPARSRAIAEFW